MTSDRKLEIGGISKQFGSTVAVQGLTLSVRAGEIFGFVGRNGAGKTTTMRIVLGVLNPDAGDVRWDGVPLTFESRRRIGYMPEERGHYPKMRVAEQLGLPRRTPRHGRRCRQGGGRPVARTLWPCRPCAGRGAGAEHVTLLSLVPPFAPILMSERMAGGDADAWQIVLALALMLISIPVLIWFASRISRIQCCAPDPGWALWMRGVAGNVATCWSRPAADWRVCVMPKVVLIVLLTAGVMMIGLGLRIRPNRYSYLIAAAGVALLTATGVLRLALGGDWSALVVAGPRR